jgi:hypothetical protein
MLNKTLFTLLTMIQFFGAAANDLSAATLSPMTSAEEGSEIIKDPSIKIGGIEYEFLLPIGDYHHNNRILAEENMNKRKLILGNVCKLFGYDYSIEYKRKPGETLSTTNGFVASQCSEE